MLRNRRAAQSSRERKRLEVEALEIRNMELEAQLLKVQRANLLLFQELKRVRGGSAVNPVTFSQELFSSHDGHSVDVDASKPSLDELLMTSTADSQAGATINPTSLSPALSPVPDDMEDDEDDDEDDAAAVPAAVASAPPCP